MSDTLEDFVQGVICEDEDLMKDHIQEYNTKNSTVQTSSYTYISTFGVHKMVLNNMVDICLDKNICSLQYLIRQLIKSTTDKLLLLQQLKFILVKIINARIDIDHVLKMLKAADPYQKQILNRLLWPEFTGATFEPQSNINFDSIVYLVNHCNQLSYDRGQLLLHLFRLCDNTCGLAHQQIIRDVFDVIPFDRKDERVLEAALRFNNLDVIKIVLDHGFVPNLKNIAPLLSNLHLSHISLPVMKLLFEYCDVSAIINQFELRNADYELCTYLESMGVDFKKLYCYTNSGLNYMDPVKGFDQST